jgi:DNA ligase D-like protein (predicted polymerase)/DNA ligase D-like protein (predicted ligase)/DNA ligase D-like protein (predicted 3'-phosphoesterase)
MPSKYVHTEIEGQKIKLSNLNKVIYPAHKITKAEIIQYYLDIAEQFLIHIADRPLSLIRYPDGIDKERFYAKEKPAWTPEWIPSIKIEHSKEPINYVYIQNKAAVAWLANLSALEIHPMQMTIDTLEQPDYFVFDLDPPEDTDFLGLKKIAFDLKDFLQEKKYVPFVKTSGSKGLHILVPIKKEYTHEEMVESVKTLAKQFVKKYPENCTLHLAKDKRNKKTLIDIYRNHKAQTTVGAYSLRGKPGAPISMPLSWEKLDEIEDSQHFTIRNYKEYIEESIKAWSKWKTAGAPLHNIEAVPEEPDPELEKKLSSYIQKRDFSKTDEPAFTNAKGNNDRYVIQLHDASNLHYDLRLEMDNVLKSWAIPKGLPMQKGIKRMAIQTEDHPLKYLDWEGTIPKGEYGAGKMWIYESGTYKVIEQTEKKIKFELRSATRTRAYHIYRTRDAQWLTERIDDSESIMEHIPEPMLADVSKTVPTGKKYSYEIKWDGIRAIIAIENEKVVIKSRSGRDISYSFPELQDIHKSFEMESGIFDCEIVSMDEQGRPVFSQVISRMHTQGKDKILQRSKSSPVYCYVFDCLSLDGKDITKLPLKKRKAWLRSVIKNGGHYRYSEDIPNGKDLYEAAKKMDLEGIMAKDIDHAYFPGQRSRAWLKIKFRTTDDCIILGYTKGQGDRSALFGAIHLGKLEAGKMKYMGKVGTGYNVEKMKILLKRFLNTPQGTKIVQDKIESEKDTTWLEPVLHCEIEYASLTNNGTYREPVFKKMRDDLN